MFMFCLCYVYVIFMWCLCYVYVIARVTSNHSVIDVIPFIQAALGRSTSTLSIDTIARVNFNHRFSSWLGGGWCHWCLYYVYVMFKLWLCYVYVMFISCLWHVYVVFMLCLCYDNVMFRLCLCYVYIMFILCFCYVYVMFLLYLCHFVMMS